MRLLCVVLIVLPCLSAFGQHWVEDSFEDFTDGRLDAAGQNLYVSRDGAVRTIHRFDLNDDGWIDLLFNGTHDLIGILPSVVGTVGSERSVRTAPLAVEGALAVASGDLNRDGWLDLVMCPNPQGVQHPRRFLTVLYGGADGWPASRSNGMLPVHGAKDVALADLNRDGWLDIAALNAAPWLPGQPPGLIVRVFWGGEHGFLLTSYRDFGVPNALGLASADFDEDGAADLAVLKSDAQVHVLWSGTAEEPEESAIKLPSAEGRCLAAGDVDGDGKADLVVGTSTESVYLVINHPRRDWREAQAVPAFPASHVAVGDADSDGHPDLVLTESAIAHAAGGEAIGAERNVQAELHVLWGNEGGFDKTRATELAVPNATAAALGDLDGDGRADLGVSVYQGPDGAFAAPSAILFGAGNRSFDPPAAGPAVSGATDALIAPPEHELPARLVFCNSQGGHVDERVDLDLYLGGPDGFSVDRRRKIPFASGYEATAADFNADGFVDLVALCSGHAGGSAAEAMTQLGANLYEGRKSGMDFSAPAAVLREYNLYSSNTADLDKDGYLDLVLGAFAPPPTPGETDLLVIYHGGKDGFDPGRRVAIPSEGRSSICAIADFNRDDWLDIAVTSYGKDRARIFWGGASGFAAERRQDLAIPAPIELETADFNADGWLDLAVGSYEDAVALHHDTGLLLFWGGPGGFAEWNAQWLPGYTPLGLTAADWDADGYLDLLSSHYHGELTREQLPSYLYWGGPDGFATRNRTVFVCDSPSDALAADFDRDGRLDVAIACHTRDGDHATDSKVFYNDGKRFADPRITRLPTVGPHWMWTEDMGRIYDRRFEQAYESSVFSWDRPASGGTLEAAATVPEGASVAIETRSATDSVALAQAAWQKASGGVFTVNPDHRALQYRVVFHSDNGDRFPTLDRVTVTLTP